VAILVAVVSVAILVAVILVAVILVVVAAVVVARFDESDTASIRSFLKGSCRLMESEQFISWMNDSSFASFSAFYGLCDCCCDCCCDCRP
jgi:hypothetical protein